MKEEVSNRSLPEVVACVNRTAESGRWNDDGTVSGANLRSSLFKFLKCRYEENEMNESLKTLERRGYIRIKENPFTTESETFAVILKMIPPLENWTEPAGVVNDEAAPHRD